MAVRFPLLVLVFVLLVPAPQPARGNVSRLSPMDDLSPQIVTIDFKVVTDDYQTFLNKLFEVLKKTPTHREVEGIPVLAQQRLNAVPARWIHVKFVGTDAVADKTTVAIRDDNLYIVGFTNFTEHWFEFERPAHLIPGHLIPGSSVLPFGSDYNSLFGKKSGETGGYKELPGIKLGKANMLEAVRKLALHDPIHPNPELKVALATLCVVVAEASRFRPIGLVVAQGWNGTPQITADLAKLVVLWGDISKALLIWQKTKVWDKNGNLRKKANINGLDDAVRTLRLVVWPNDFTFSFDAITADDDGKPLADDSSTTCNGTSCD